MLTRKQPVKTGHATALKHSVTGGKKPAEQRAGKAFIFIPSYNNLRWFFCPVLLPLPWHFKIRLSPLSVVSQLLLVLANIFSFETQSVLQLHSAICSTSGSACAAPQILPCKKTPTQLPAPSLHCWASLSHSHLHHFQCSDLTPLFFPFVQHWVWSILPLFSVCYGGSLKLSS